MQKRIHLQQRKIRIHKKTQRPQKRSKRWLQRAVKPAQAAQTASKSRSKPRNGSAKKRSKGERELPIKISFLGGLNEVGKNMTLYEYKDDMFLVDCGLAFPRLRYARRRPGHTDFTYVERNVQIR